jgi:F-type H+-transporting ATPase subunit delta
MRETTIAGTYADVLLELAQRAEDPQGWGRMFGDVAAAVENDAHLGHFLESPRIGDTRKIEVLHRAFGNILPAPLVRFLETLVRHRRQMLLTTIATEYNDRLDALEGRVHADVTVARGLSEKERSALAAQLTRTVGEGRDVVPVVRVHPPILGGVIVRIGDRVVDGSVRTRLARLRHLLASAR